MNLYILNGRVGNDRLNGQTTCKNTSVVDYCIGNLNFLSVVNDFSVLPFSSILSDVHNPISVCLKIHCQSPTPIDNNDTRNYAGVGMPIKWQDKKTSIFTENVKVNIDTINELCNMFNEIHVSDITCDFIDNTVSKLCNLLLDCAKDTFGVRKNRNRSVNKILRSHCLMQGIVTGKPNDCIELWK
jgi:hypothetical protein